MLASLSLVRQMPYKPGVWRRPMTSNNGIPFRLFSLKALQDTAAVAAASDPKIINQEHPILPALSIEPNTTAITVKLTESSEPDLKTLPNKGYILRLLEDFNARIEVLSHMDDVRKAQDRVLLLKDQLIISGQQKREILSKLSEIRTALKRVHSNSLAVNRATEGYVALVRTEMELTKQEERLQNDYDKADEIERILFTNLTAAINDSYEKEKIHSNTLRLWGLIATIFTSAITLILSSVGHYYHTTQLGLVGSKFKDADSIHREISVLKTIVEKINREQEDAKIRNAEKTIKSESWNSFLIRMAISPYRYFVPKKQ